MPKNITRRALYAGLLSCLAIATVGLPILALAQGTVAATPASSAMLDLGALGPLIGGSSGGLAVAFLIWLVKSEREERKAERAEWQEERRAERAEFRQIIGELRESMDKVAEAQSDTATAMNAIAHEIRGPRMVAAPIPQSDRERFRV